MKIEREVVIAESGLLSKKNVSELTKLGYLHILWSRIKVEDAKTKKTILAMRLKHGQSNELARRTGRGSSSVT